MTYRSLLVHLDEGVACHERTQYAIRLATERECHLVGVAPTGLINVPQSTEPSARLTDYTARARDDLRDHAEQLTQRFRNACSTAGLTSVEVLIDEADRASSLVHHTHYCDLVIMSQARPDSAQHGPARSLVEDVVLHGARPTLILPHAGTFANPGSSVLVAWDGSREAARALADALPLLHRARHVQVVCWREVDGGDESTRRASLDAIHRWLTRHGISSKVYLETADQGIAHAMRLRAAEIRADLIVMGAYGHARWLERVLGGATRGMLDGMNVPVLMSH